jgi:hypothetical protein
MSTLKPKPELTIAIPEKSFSRDMIVDTTRKDAQGAPRACTTSGSLGERLAASGYELKEVNSAGHCQFDALKDQVNPSQDLLHCTSKGGVPSVLSTFHLTSQQLTIQLSTIQISRFRNEYSPDTGGSLTFYQVKLLRFFVRFCASRGLVVPPRPAQWTELD